MTATQYLVGMADIHVQKGPAIYTCLGLGSCVGLCALDPTTNVSGMIHVMLPAAFKDREVDKIGKFADTGVPEMVRLMQELGASASTTVVAYAGGAQVFKFGANTNDRLDVGSRNVIAVEQQLKALGLSSFGSEVGGSNGRTVVFNAETGEVKVRSVTGGEKLLAKLGR